MDKKDDGRFIFGADDTHEPVAHDEIPRSRLDSLNLKVTLIAIIMPCLIGLMMVFGYIDMTRRVSVFKNSGSQEVRDASKDMERMISSLQVKNARMEKQLANELGEIKTRLTTLETKLGKTGKNVDFITATRITKKQAEAHVRTLKLQLNENKTVLTLLQSDTAETIDRTRALEKKGVDETRSLIHIKGELATIQKKVSSIDRSIPSMKEIDARLKKERILMQVRIDEARTSLNTRIDTVAKERRRAAVPTPPAPPAQKAGTITEQEIGG